jgi:hypothetical protein
LGVQNKIKKFNEMIVKNGKPFSFDKTDACPKKRATIMETILDVVVFLLTSLGYILQVGTYGRIIEVENFPIQIFHPANVAPSTGLPRKLFSPG